MSKNTPVGQTKSQGWEIGVRRTLPIAPEKAWELLTSAQGLDLWLGHNADLTFEKGAAFKTREGTTGEIRSYEKGRLLRMRWQPPDWDFASTLQIRVNPARSGATISIHHEKLENGEQRQAMRQHWSTVLDKLETIIKQD
jgi:uncharacterized protein YndB with AHSA1/START domain